MSNVFRDQANTPYLNVIYVLFGLSVFINVLFPVALVLTAWQRSKATQWAVSHYHYLLKYSLWAFGFMLLSAALIHLQLSLGVWLVIPIKLWFAYMLFLGARALLKQQSV
ncbi:MAG: hypothetical protein ABIM24_05485 [Paraperlucidibaca sp.]